MSVRPYKKKNGEVVPGKWEIDFRPEGKNGPRVNRQYPEDGTTCGYDKALAFEQSCRRLHVHHHAKRIVNPSLNMIMPEYLEWHKLYRAARTHSDLLYSLKNIMAVFGELPVSRITPGEIVKFSQLRPAHPRATNKDLHYLGGIISWMVENGHAEPLPFKIKQVPYAKPLPNPPTATETEAFLSQIKQSDKLAICIMMFEAGTRWNETVTMRWETVDLGAGQAKVLAKGNKWRSVLLPRRVVDLIAANKKPTGWVFPNPKTGKPYGSFKTLFRLACQRAGIRPIHPHELRHRAATDTLEATGDLRLVQKMLGHADIATTTIYTQVDTSRLQEAATRVADLRRRQQTP